MMRRMAAFLILMITWTGAALAQEGSWIQIEARPTLRQAEDRARTYSSALQNVSGYALGSGWYAIALGPYSRPEALARLRALRGQGAIPNDAFVADGGNFRQRFWPAGRDEATSAEGQVVIEQALPDAPPETAQAETAQAETAQADPAPDVPETPAVPAQPVEETVAEARASERALTEQERKDLQIAMQWEGFYDAAIDGDFGAGTRRAMSAYQTAKGLEATGVLTTRQRTALLQGYRQAFDELELSTVVDDRAGIEVMMPTALVKFGKVEPPFVHYDPSTDRQVRVLLISQSGNRNTLYGLYDIMQTLAIVPTEGERSKSGDSFVLRGRNQLVESYTWARLEDGQIKGFTLVFPPEESKVMTRVAEMMRDSFAATGDTVLDPAAGGDAVPSVDLVSGLEVRRPVVSRSGFYVDGAGTVVTTADAVAQCARVTIDESFEADVASVDAASGMAILKPRQTLAPLAHATFRTDTPALDTDVAISGFSYEGALGAPTVTYGKLSDLRGLGGDEAIQRLNVRARTGDAGGPVFDQAGTVLGMLLSRGEADRQLPEDVYFAIKPEPMGKMLSEQGVTPQNDGATGIMAPEDLALLASDMTVLVSCWN